jgi:hypothetical protein
MHGTCIKIKQHELLRFIDELLLVSALLSGKICIVALNGVVVQSNKRIYE